MTAGPDSTSLPQTILMKLLLWDASLALVVVDHFNWLSTLRQHFLLGDAWNLNSRGIASLVTASCAYLAVSVHDFNCHTLLNLNCRLQQWVENKFRAWDYESVWVMCLVDAGCKGGSKPSSWIRISFFWADVLRALFWDQYLLSVSRSCIPIGFHSVIWKMPLWQSGL